MGIFFEKPTKGPDVVGGIWPTREIARMWNRSGLALDKGDVVAVATRPGEATEIATNDANSYIPGMSNDTVWNTVIDATTNLIQKGGIFAVVLDDVISDNKAGTVCVFGMCDAFVTRSNTTSTPPGSPLTVFVSNGAARGNTFDPIALSNEAIVAMLLATSNAALTTKRLKRVFLHQGLFYSPCGIASGIS